MNNEDIDQTKCPLCGEDNRCGNLVNEASTLKSSAISSKEQCEDCWCMKSEVSFLETLLQQIPQGLQNKSCICQRCALTFANSIS